MASLYPNLRLVTGPSESATVLMDLCDDEAAAPRRILAEGFSLGAPELEGDPDAIDPLYGPRTIEATLEVQGSKAEALALLSSLARILVTGYTGGFIPGLWLRVQVEPELPVVWFRLLRPALSALSWENVYTREGAPADRWAVDLDLPAEAFGYGPRETIAAQTVNNDPTAATSPCRIDLGAIKGDAPAPLRLAAVYSMATGGGQGLVLAHATSGAAPDAVNIPIGTGDGLSAGTDTSAGDADVSDIGGTHRTVSFATTTVMQSRLNGSTPALRPGRYKAILRMGGGGGTKVMMRLTMDSIVGNAVLASWVVSTPHVWVDLGDFTLPARVPQRASDQGPAAAVTFFLEAQQLASNSITMDHLLLIPIGVSDTLDTSGLVARTSEPNTRTVVTDGDTGDIWAYITATGALAPWTYSSYGVWPTVVPGGTNTLWWINNVEPFEPTGPSVKTASSSVIGYYYPRYLNVPGA